jgi:hypothetical protein
MIRGDRVRPNRSDLHTDIDCIRSEPEHKNLQQVKGVRGSKEEEEEA